MKGITIFISPEKRVLVIEDNAFRIAWFREHLNVASTTYCTTKESGLAVLKNGAPFDAVFLDYDSGPLMWQEGQPDDDTFYDVAKRLVALNFPGAIVIHSMNPVGAERLWKLFGNKKDVWVFKFGTFEIAPYDKRLVRQLH